MKQVCIALTICLIFISAVSATKEHEAAAASAKQAIKSFGGWKGSGRGLAPVVDATYWTVEFFSDSACTTSLTNDIIGVYNVLGCFSDGTKSMKVTKDPGRGLNITRWMTSGTCSGTPEAARNNVRDRDLLSYYHYTVCTKIPTNQLPNGVGGPAYAISSIKTAPYKKGGKLVIREYLVGISNTKCNKDLVSEAQVYDATGECSALSRKIIVEDNEFRQRVIVEDYTGAQCTGTQSKAIKVTKKCEKKNGDLGWDFYVTAPDPLDTSGAGRLDYLTTLLVSLAFLFGVIMV